MANQYTHNPGHGHTVKGPSRTYKSWVQMKDRCLNPKSPDYAIYGGRGITICARWKNSFEDFFFDMGERPPQQSLDRINNDGNYEPGNCRWAIHKEQMRNRGEYNRLITANGETRCMAEWVEISGLTRHTIHHRLKRGWPPYEAIFTPPIIVRSH